VAQGYQGFTVAGALLDGDVPFGADRGQNAQCLRGVSPSEVGEMAEGAAMIQMIGGMVGRKRQGLQRERRGDQ